MVPDPGDHFTHSLQPGILVAVPDPAAGPGPGGVDVNLPAGGGHADGDIFDRTAEPGHGVAFEVGKDHPVCVIFRVAADDGPVDPRTAGHRPFHFAVLIHQVEVRESGEAVVCGDLFMHGCVGAGTAVCRVAFDDRAVQGLNEGPDQFGAQVVAVRRFAGGDFDRHPVPVGPVQGFINPLQPFRRDIRGEINSGNIRFLRGSCERVQQHRGQRK